MAEVTITIRVKWLIMNFLIGLFTTKDTKGTKLGIIIIPPLVSFVLPLK